MPGLCGLQSPPDCKVTASQPIELVTLSTFAIQTSAEPKDTTTPNPVATARSLRVPASSPFSLTSMGVEPSLCSR